MNPQYWTTEACRRPNGTEQSMDWGIFDEEDELIAEVFEIVAENKNRSVAAHAKLIADAPELLAALKSEHLIAIEGHRLLRTATCEICGLIAKAEGMARPWRDKPP